VAKRIDWDSANRQARLRKWIQNHDSYSWVDDIPNEAGANFEEWAKRQVRKSVSKVRNDLESQKQLRNTPEGKVSDLLVLASVHLEDGEFEDCRKIMTEVVNLIARSNLTSIKSESRLQVVQVVSMLSEILD
jgi:hypothetical protein